MAAAGVAAETCDYCHDNSFKRGGQAHQDVYNRYTDESVLALDLESVVSTGEAAPYSVVLTFTVTKNGEPVTDLSTLTLKNFYAVEYDPATATFRNNVGLTATPVATGTPGQYTITRTDFTFKPEETGQVFGRVASDRLTIEPLAYVPSIGKRVQMYDNVGADSLASEVAAGYDSAANVSACEDCHGTPYMKHGTIPAENTGGITDFASCKSCHVDAGTGSHLDWQWMVDDPYEWATDATPADYTTRYAYKTTLMNDVHMPHAMEFPYPQSMANCNTCHAGKLDRVLDNSQFKPETCLSCHPVKLQDTYVDANGDTQYKYWDDKRAPAMEDLWLALDPVGEVYLDLHSGVLNRNPDGSFISNDCRSCHNGATAATFDELHSGYNAAIYNPATGARWSATKTVSITSVTKTGDTINVKFSASDPATVPELLVSFYGYDTKDYLVSSHTRDASTACRTSSGGTSACRYEYEAGANLDDDPNNNNPLFTEVATGVAGTWDVTVNLATYVQPTSTGLASIPTLISTRKIRKLEISVLGNLEVGDEAVATVPAMQTYAVTASSVSPVSNYYSGTNAIVETAKCNKCHDALGTTFHDPSYGSAQVCRNCHVPTSGGSHLEMQSRSIDSYAHAIHAFQWFDAGCRDGSGTSGCSTDFTDPVVAERYAEHTRDTWPLFTINACEGCHKAGKFDKAMDATSMPAQLSASYVNVTTTWARGPEPVQNVGPANKACMGCHRTYAINADNAGELADLNGHMKAESYMLDNTTTNPSTTSWIYRVIDKIMATIY
jgi:OmcA/MtrC family decaheme c-type cytochrome